MATGHSRNGYSGDRERGRRDWLLFLLILLLGFGCMLVAAEMAVRPDSLWRVSADMLSSLNPDEGDEFEAGELQLAPLRPEVLTPIWDAGAILTPMGTLVVVPTVVFGPLQTTTLAPTATGTLTPTLTANSTPTSTRLP